MFKSGDRMQSMKWGLGVIAGMMAVGCQQPSPHLAQSVSQPCDATLGAISSRLNRPHMVSPCKDSTPNPLLGEKDFSKKRVGSIMVFGIAAMSISEFDLSIKAGRDGMKQMMDEGEYGQRPYKINSSTLAVFQDSPFFFRGFTATQEGRKALDEYKIDDETAKWLESASEAELQGLRNDLKAELMAAAGL